MNTDGVKLVQLDCCGVATLDALTPLVIEILLEGDAYLLVQLFVPGASIE